VDGYIAGLEPWQAAIVSQVREIVRAAAPDAAEAFKWAQPVYELEGPFAYVKAFKAAVNVGFWRGVELEAPAGVLQGSGAKMRHLKLRTVDEIDAALIANLVRQAVALNRAKGNPTR
jgi:hypothetical protein